MASCAYVARCRTIAGPHRPAMFISRSRTRMPASTPWSALNGQTLISLTRSYPHQQLIDEHLAKTGVRWQRGVVVNFMDTHIALVEAAEGIAIIPSFGLPACSNRRVVMSQLTTGSINWSSIKLATAERNSRPAPRNSSPSFRPTLLDGPAAPESFSRSALRLGT